MSNLSWTGLLLPAVSSFTYGYMVFSKPRNRHNGKEQTPFVKDKQHSVVFKSCIIETLFPKEPANSSN